MLLWRANGKHSIAEITVIDEYKLQRVSGIRVATRKTVRREGIESIKKSFYLCSLLSNTQFVNKQNASKLN